MNADCPETSGETVGKDQVDVDWNEVATGEDWNRLDEGIQRVEGEPSKRGDCSRGVVNDVDLFVYRGMVKQPMPPIGQELIIAHMEKQVKRSHCCESPLVLHFGVVRVSHLDERYKRRLSQNVEE